MPEVVEVSGIAVDRYEPLGHRSGPPIVIVHGAMDRAAGFRRTIRHLPNRLVLAYDRRGYGTRHDVAPAAEFNDHLVDLAAVLSLVDEPALVVGHSFGGLVALWALATAPLNHHLLGAVIWEAPLAWEPWYQSSSDDLLDLDPPDAAERFMRGVLGESLWERLPSAMKQQRRTEGDALLADLRDARLAATQVPTDLVTDPVIVGFGGRSGPRHQRSAQRCAQTLSDAQLVEIADADHGVHLSKPASFAALIESWGTPSA